MRIPKFSIAILKLTLFPLVLFSFYLFFNQSDNSRYVSGSLNTKKYFFGDYEKIESGGATRYIHYVAAGNGLCAIIEKYAGSSSIIHFIYTDYLGSLLTRTDIYGNVTAEQNFDAWGRSRNINTWQYAGAGITPSFFDRGYTGHEHLSYHYLINMNGRMYDPIMGRMLSPDNYVPDPLHTQGYNRYTYANNNPLVYTDPDGDFPWLAVIAGALIGGVSNGINYAKQGKSFFGGFWRGALVGGASAYIGATIAASGMPFALTAGIVSSSFYYSVGMNLLTGGQTPVSVSFGFGSYNFQSGEFSYLGKKGNSPMMNVAFAFGAMANLQDLVTGIWGGDYQYQYEIGKNGKIGHGNIREVQLDGSTKVKISVANKTMRWSERALAGEKTKIGEALEWLWKANFRKYTDGPDYWLAVPEEGWPRIPLRLNSEIVDWMAKNLDNNKGLWGITRTRFGIAYGCSSYAARALFTAGVPTIPIINMLGPRVLWLQLAIRQAGIYSSPYLYSIGE